MLNRLFSHTLLIPLPLYPRREVCVYNFGGKPWKHKPLRAGVSEYTVTRELELDLSRGHDEPRENGPGNTNRL